MPADDVGHDDLARDIESAHKSIREMRGSIGQLFSQYTEVSAEIKELRRTGAEERREYSKALSEMRGELKSYYDNIARMISNQSVHDARTDERQSTSNVLLYVVLGVVIVQLLVGWLK